MRLACESTDVSTAWAATEPIADTDDESRFAARRIADTLSLIDDALRPQRRMLHTGGALYRGGEGCANLYVVHSGCFKLLRLAPDGREQIVGLKFRGDWIGFDGIADRRFHCEAVALDTSEAWAMDYRQLLAACADRPALMMHLHDAMSREIVRDRDALMSVCTLPADARVAQFLRDWVQCLALRGLRTDRITLRMTRAEIGSYLGLTLETVSRALSRLARRGVIEFAAPGRRDICIPDIDALVDFAGSTSQAGAAALQ